MSIIITNEDLSEAIQSLLTSHLEKDSLSLAARGPKSVLHGGPLERVYPDAFFDGYDRPQKRAAFEAPARVGPTPPVDVSRGGDLEKMVSILEYRPLRG